MPPFLQVSVTTAGNLVYLANAPGGNVPRLLARSATGEQVVLPVRSAPDMFVDSSRRAWPSRRSNPESTVSAGSTDARSTRRSARGTTPPPAQRLEKSSCAACSYSTIWNSPHRSAFHGRRAYPSINSRTNAIPQATPHPATASVSTPSVARTVRRRRSRSRRFKAGPSLRGPRARCGRIRSTRRRRAA